MITTTLQSTALQNDRTERHKTQIKRRLYLYFFGLFSLNLLCLSFFIFGNFVSFSNELINISTSYIPFSVFMSFRLLNLTYSEFKRSKELQPSTRTAKETRADFYEYQCTSLGTQESYELKFSPKHQASLRPAG